MGAPAGDGLTTSPSGRVGRLVRPEPPAGRALGPPGGAAEPAAGPRGKGPSVTAGGARVGGPVVVAPEVAARILARRADGRSIAAISAELHLTPREVLTVVHGGTVAPAVPIESGPLAAALVATIRRGTQR